MENKVKSDFLVIKILKVLGNHGCVVKRGTVKIHDLFSFSIFVNIFGNTGNGEKA